ncbi:hypothetical protein JB92DRAFT_2004277 [Gautieria morchelliformis]|nr:hypothetical protein JB92DRAFT_2004277 [Gautieria morchelliformis]
MPYDNYGMKMKKDLIIAQKLYSRPGYSYISPFKTVTTRHLFHQVPPQTAGSVCYEPTPLVTMSTTSTSRARLPRPLHLISNSGGTSVLSTPLSAGAHGPLSAPLNRNVKEPNGTDVAKSKRQSSISYNTGSLRARSPARHGRSNSLGSKVAPGARGDEKNPSTSSSLPGVRETEPVTLAERHADLLRFIAQKESKCLELRTQLAQHEADLLLLKRKWERIVSKGLPSSARSEIPTNTGSDVLGGIREGVQSGLGRVLAVLEPSPAGPSSIPQVPPSTSQMKSERHSHSTTREVTTSVGKRASISTVSSGSTPDRSSMSGSRSSASSLFDELSSPERQSLTSSTEGGTTACASPETETFDSAHSLHAAKGNFSYAPRSLKGQDTEASDYEDNSLQQRRSTPYPVNVLHTTPLSASVTSESLTPLSRHMANWVPPGLNKKWEELKGNETLSKQSKRASILLTDVLAVLAPPIPPSPKTSSSTIPRRNSTLLQHPSPHNLDSTFFDPTTSGARSVLSPSLLDEDDECKLGEVLQPQVKVPEVAMKVGETGSEGDKDDDEWNW